MQLSYQDIFAGQTVGNAHNNTLVHFLGSSKDRVTGTICARSSFNATFEHEAITTGNIDVEVLENYD